ncbi:helix-turn-helix domain-containing protein [Rubellicoccus peritrichatus]|uniref:Helix-turn-helix domain-containing protein n=1 Tax=Rubellicoccus peritrichatus TaxID=3080537 RepID=A0AAQ3L6V5_9BACT|nr:helix-turn-helix domain-containing protein [Puniceicoccus sp. CR14]WOO40649.1 helix-turn-helix domain-containing protein [Puniceicoccus sp. CR14]
MKALESESMVSNGSPVNLSSTLANSEVFLTFQSAYKNLTGMSLWLKSSSKDSSSCGKCEEANPFCYLLSAHKKCCRECLGYQTHGKQNPDRAANTNRCFAGISNTQIPISRNERTIGCLSTGFVSLDDQEPDNFQKIKRKLRDDGIDADMPSLEKAWKQTQLIQKSDYDSSIQLASTFANHLAMMAEHEVPNLMLATRSNCNPALERAIDYIKAHLQDPLSLDEVANAVNISRCYFSRLFKEKFGVSFTTYVSSLRVEQTKQLLIRSDLSITEIAFKVGFQSMSQFNRTFKDFEQQTPSTFRKRTKGSGQRPRWTSVD